MPDLSRGVSWWVWWQQDNFALGNSLMTPAFTHVWTKQLFRDAAAADKTVNGVNKWCRTTPRACRWICEPNWADTFHEKHRCRTQRMKLSHNELKRIRDWKWELSQHKVETINEWLNSSAGHIFDYRTIKTGWVLTSGLSLVFGCKLPCR